MILQTVFKVAGVQQWFPIVTFMLIILPLIMALYSERMPVKGHCVAHSSQTLIICHDEHQ